MYRARVWYSPAELAAALGVERHSVHRWIRQGKVKAFKPSPTGKHMRITADEAQRVIRERLNEAARKWSEHGE